MDIKKQFLEPPNEFTPFPFWFWNGDLDSDEILRQINEFYLKGITGFIIHPRIGIPKTLKYLSEPFMDLVHVAVAEAQRLNMKVILYDEGMYPSGSANGQVVRSNPEYASKGIRMEEILCSYGDNDINFALNEGEQIVSIQAVKKIDRYTIDIESTECLAIQDLKFNFKVESKVESWSIVFLIETFSKGTIRGIHYGEDDGEINAPLSSDLLNPLAVETFINLTHERYYAKLKKYFGSTIIAMFTDEPEILGRSPLSGLFPWSHSFLSYYLSNGNAEAQLPLLWLNDISNKESRVRINYRRTINKRLKETYYKPIADWCELHHISLTGHPAGSEDIGLLEHFDIPGQDVVWRWVAPERERSLEGTHSTAAKCSADSARHRNKKRNLNEVLGVCALDGSWYLTPDNMKWYFDWLFIRGVNLIVPHAFYYSIEGARKNERPPDVGLHNNWWPYFKSFSTYIKRMSFIMSDSSNQTKTAILCNEDTLPWKVAKQLYQNQWEFNYLEESLLINAHVQGNQLKINDYIYEILIIDCWDTLNAASKDLIRGFISMGGRVIFSNDVIDGGINVHENSTVINLLSEITSPEVQLHPKNKDIRVSKVKKSNYILYIMSNESETEQVGELVVKEKGKIEKWDVWNGLIEDCGFSFSIDKDKIVPFELERRQLVIFAVMLNSEDTYGEFVEREKNLRSNQIELNNWTLEDRGNILLESWTKWEGLEYYSGSLIYSHKFEIQNIDKLTEVKIDLGELYEIAEVRINREIISVKMWKPYVVTIPIEMINVGINIIEVAVTNTISNSMDKKSYPSGLLGPVVLTCSEELNS